MTMRANGPAFNGRPGAEPRWNEEDRSPGRSVAVRGDPAAAWPSVETQAHLNDGKRKTFPFVLPRETRQVDLQFPELLVLQLSYQHRIGTVALDTLADDVRRVHLADQVTEFGLARPEFGSRRPAPRDDQGRDGYDDQENDDCYGDLHLRDNDRPISGGGGAAPALERREAYPPARSTALAGYLAAFSPLFGSQEVENIR